MVAAMAGFALEDMALKTAMRAVPVGEALVEFGLLGMCGFIALAKSRGQKVINPALLSRVIALRAFSEVMGRLGYTLAIALIPLSNASAILQATPLVVVGARPYYLAKRWGGSAGLPWRSDLSAL
jgi:drug/metabolite transporter (DMT)-like permease